MILSTRSRGGLIGRWELELERYRGKRILMRVVLVLEFWRRGEGEWVMIIWRGRGLLFERRGGMMKYLVSSAPYETSGWLPVGTLTPVGRTVTVSVRCRVGHDEDEWWVWLVRGRCSSPGCALKVRRPLRKLLDSDWGVRRW
ncbi:hypothetical protein FRC08_018830 [Ceratobasidium sp. 394]|nr:hypothetical protein FRC08_018830 [Ceratobasidium sp. 394]